MFKNYCIFKAKTVPYGYNLKEKRVFTIFYTFVTLPVTPKE